MGKPWIAYSWLFDVISASAFARLGLVSIVLWDIAARVALSVALFHLVRGLCPSFWRAVALTAAGLWVMTEVIGPRPGMLTILFVILEFDVLLSAAAGPGVRKRFGSCLPCLRSGPTGISSSSTGCLCWACLLANR